MRAPTPQDEESRLEALRRYQILDSMPEEAFDRITRLASHIMQTPISLISLVDEERQWFKSAVGLDATETPREVAFCAHAILGEDVLEIQNAKLDARFADNPLVCNAPHIRFYAGAPLQTSDGFALGTLCVIDQVPRALSDSQRSALKDLAALVVDELELRLRSREQSDMLERMRQALEQSRVGLFRLVRRDCILPAPGCLSLLGFEAEELPEGTQLWLPEMVHPQERELVLDGFQRLSMTYTVDLVYRIRTRQGGWMWVASTLMQSPEGAVGTLQDVSALMEHMRRDAKEEMHILALSRTLSTELRESLSTIRGAAEMAQGALEEDDDEEVEISFEYLYGASEHSERVIADLETFLDLDAHPCRFEPVDLSVVWASLLEKYAVQMNDMSAQFTSHDMPVVQGEYAQLHTLFEELLRNSLMYCGPNPPVLEIQAKRVEDMYEIAVHDKGLGVDARALSKMFDIFWTSRSRSEYEGRGLGLALCHRIAVRHGGEIWAKVRPGGGLSVFVRLPL